MTCHYNRERIKYVIFHPKVVTYTLYIEAEEILQSTLIKKKLLLSQKYSMLDMHCINLEAVTGGPCSNIWGIEEGWGLLGASGFSFILGFYLGFSSWRPRSTAAGAGAVCTQQELEARPLLLLGPLGTVARYRMYTDQWLAATNEVSSVLTIMDFDCKSIDAAIRNIHQS